MRYTLSLQRAPDELQQAPDLFGTSLLRQRRSPSLFLSPVGCPLRGALCQINAPPTATPAIEITGVHTSASTANYYQHLPTARCGSCEPASPVTETEPFQDPDSSHDHATFVTRPEAALKLH
ncbi:hypothetical protein AB5J72_00360 [Streptomyces sp. CG1]|uniref:hypothetical protein n=1 Tax=Streptomyces sp. CG1 TaxID=1287523 RepID=UPI0034E2237F